jgi:molybdate transport system regulatory protein
MIKNKSSFLKIKIEISKNFNIGPGKIKLLESIITNGSISEAAKEMGMSYRKAWKLVKEINNASANKIILSNTGGKGVGGTKVSGEGIKFIKAFRNIEKKVFKASVEEKKFLYELFKNNN